MGVEWGPSWSGTESRSGNDGIDTGANSDAGSDSRGEGSFEGRSYELYYTVPDDLRRPWQVRRGNSWLEAIAACF